MSYILRPKAKVDINSISKRIAENNPSAALNWYDEIVATCRMLGDLPEIGQARGDVRKDLRTFPKGNYLILFKNKGKDAIIVRVIHGARDWPKLVR